MSAEKGRTRKVGLVGTGHFAQFAYLPAILAAGNAELVGIWGRDREVSDTIAAQAGTTRFARIEDLIEAADTVAIAVAPSAQPEIAARAAISGRDLVLEKPLGLTRVDVDKLLTVVQAHRIRTVSHLTRLFDPAIAGLCEQARIPRAGELRITIRTDAMLGASPYRHSAWRADPNGALWDLGPHVLSIAQYAHGPVSAVRVANVAGDVAIEAAHTSGAVSQGFLSLTSPFPDEHVEILRGGNSVATAVPARQDPSITVAAAIEALDNDESGITAAVRDIEFAARIVHTLEAATRSARTHRWTGVDTSPVLQPISGAS